MADPRNNWPDAISADEATGEDELAYLDAENNPAELGMALQRIRKAMEKGWSYERAVKTWGIRGHPHFAEFWPVTKYWGDARYARERLGLPLDE